MQAGWMLLAMLPSDSADAPLAWLGLTVVLAVAGALLVAVLIGVIVRRVARRSPIVMEATRRGRIPLRLLLALIAVQQVVAATTVLGGWQPPLLTILQLAILATGGWLLAVLAVAVEDLTMTRFRIDVADNRRARRVRTQVSLLRRLTVAAIITAVTVSMLLTLPGAEQAGATILASAGIIGIVAGLAAQSSLSNLFAGLQLAFTDAIRVDDVVVVEGEWGRIQEITLTYVVVHVWDDRRLILPSTYFTTTAFQNWTRKESAVLGAVELDVDWRVPLTELRAELDRALHASTIWDERLGILQVTDAVGSLVRIRVLVSGIDGPTVFDLRCEIREALVSYLQHHHPEALPRIRVEQARQAGAPAAEQHRATPAGAGRSTTHPDRAPTPVQDPSESEATRTQGLFTGSIQAIQRARDFARHDEEPSSGQPGPRS